MFRTKEDAPGLAGTLQREAASASVSLSLGLTIEPRFIVWALDDERKKISLSSADTSLKNNGKTMSMRLAIFRIVEL